MRTNLSRRGTFAESPMPRISEFFGLTVYMYWFDNQKHSVAHIHVRYQGAEGVYGLDGTRIDGNLGLRVDA